MAALIDDDSAAAAPELCAAKLTAAALGVLIAALTREHGRDDGRRAPLGLLRRQDRAARVLVPLSRALEVGLAEYLHERSDPDDNDCGF
jgi:hypothetical protein